MEKKIAERIVTGYALLTWLCGALLAFFFINSLAVNDYVNGPGLRMGNLIASLLIALVLGPTFYFIGAQLFYHRSLKLFVVLQPIALIVCLFLIMLTFTISPHETDSSDMWVRVMSSLVFLIAAAAIYLFAFNSSIKGLFISKNTKTK